jgi:prepilin-type N-terminal cleavage/methylation domain-containing protein
MMNKYKVDAFTLMEVTITMLIAAILIAVTYTSYSIVIRSHTSFTNKNNDMAVLISFDHLLKRDFEQAKTILKDSAGFSFRKDTTLVRYEFSPDFIIRKAARIDTFKIQCREVNPGFENASLLDLQSTTGQNLIDELGFIILFQDEKIAYHYHKTYSSENLLEKNPNAIN